MYQLMAGGWSSETRRVLRAYLHMLAVVEPFQQKLARRHGVTLADMHALRTLRDLGEVPTSRFGAALGLRPSTTTCLVDRLESAALIVRRPSAVDRRVTTLALTDRGRGALGDRALFRDSELVQRIEQLDSAERLELAALMERMLEAPLADRSEQVGREDGPHQQVGRGGTRPRQAGRTEHVVRQRGAGRSLQAREVSHAR